MLEVTRAATGEQDVGNENDEAMKRGEGGHFVIEEAGCPLCGDVGGKRLALPHRFMGPEVFEGFRSELGLVECGCSFVYTSPRPSRALLDRFYGGLNQPKRTGSLTEPVGTSAKSDFFLEYIEGKVPGRRLFEFGAAEGVTLTAAIARGWTVSGYDVDEALLRCRALGLPMVDRLDDAPAASFDAVFMNQVFEHVEDRVGVLRALRRLLAPGGKLFVQVPNAASLRARAALPPLSRSFAVEERYRAFPVHLSFFTPDTLVRMIEKSGFDVDEVRTFGVGLDELLIERADGGAHADDATNAAAPKTADSSARARPNPKKKDASLKGRVKTFAKDLFFKSGLGEHVMVTASPGARASHR